MKSYGATPSTGRDLATKAYVDGSAQMITPQMFGAVGDGVADDHAAVVAWIAATGLHFVPAGSYRTGQLVLPHGFHAFGVNSGTYNNTFGNTQRSRFVLKNGINDHHVLVPVTSNRIVLTDLEFDGNKTGQTAAGHGIYFVDDVAQNEAQGILERLYVHDHSGTGIRVGVWRQAVHMHDVIVNFAYEHGMNIVGTDCVISRPIIGDNQWAGIAVSGNVTVIEGGAIYNNESGISIAGGIKRVTLIANGVDKNLKQGIVIGSGCAGINVIGTKMTSNGRLTNNTYPHIDVQTTTGFVTLVGNSFSPLEPGVTNASNYAVQLASGATAYDVGNNYEGGSVNGYTNDISRLFVTTRPAFRESMPLWMSDAVASVAGQGLDLPSAATALDATFSGTSRTLTPAEGGREAQLSVRARKITSTAASTITVRVVDSTNSANILCTVNIVSTNTAGSNYEAIGTWTTVPTWFSTAASKNVVVQTLGGNGADDWVFRDITLKWRG